MTQLSYCGAMLRKHDRQQFLLCLFAQASMRASLFPLYAVLQEIMSIPLKTDDVAAAQLRLKWWHDKMISVYQGEVVQGHPVLEEFSRHLIEGGKENFLQIIEAVQDMLLSQKIEDILCAYQKIATHEMSLVSELLDVQVEPQLAEIIAKTRLLFSVPKYLVAQRQPLLPEDFWQDTANTKLWVKEGLSDIRALRKNWKNKTLVGQGAVLWLSLSLADYQFKHIERCNYDVTDGRLVELPLSAIVRLYLRATFRRF